MSSSLINGVLVVTNEVKTNEIISSAALKMAYACEVELGHVVTKLSMKKRDNGMAVLTIYVYQNGRNVPVRIDLYKFSTILSGYTGLLDVLQRYCGCDVYQFDIDVLHTQEELNRAIIKVHNGRGRNTGKRWVELIKR